MRNKPSAKLWRIQKELIGKMRKLEVRFQKEYGMFRMEYEQVKMIELVANYIKALEYHYRDNVNPTPNAKEYKAAVAAMNKYTRYEDEKDCYTDKVLRDEFKK